MYEYYYGTEAEQFNFIKIPRAFFTDKEKFGKLSNEAKIMYLLLLDRMNLSMKNGWLDEHNRVYIIYTIDEMQKQWVAEQILLFVFSRNLMMKTALDLSTRSAGELVCRL